MKMTLKTQEIMINEDDAPEGFYPIPKESVRPPGNYINPKRKNICTECDWRPDCSGRISCMSYKRADHISVIFKTKPGD